MSVSIHSLRLWLVSVVMVYWVHLLGGGVEAGGRALVRGEAAAGMQGDAETVAVCCGPEGVFKVVGRARVTGRGAGPCRRPPAKGQQTAKARRREGAGGRGGRGEGRSGPNGAAPRATPPPPGRLHGWVHVVLAQGPDVLKVGVGAHSGVEHLVGDLARQLQPRLGAVGGWGAIGGWSGAVEGVEGACTAPGQTGLPTAPSRDCSWTAARLLLDHHPWIAPRPPLDHPWTAPRPPLDCPQIAPGLPADCPRPHLVE